MPSAASASASVTLGGCARARAMATATSRLVSTWRPSPLAWPARCSSGVGLGGGALGLQAALEEGAGGVLVERVEAEERRPAEQRRVHLEERVLGGGADERDEPALHAGEQRVLLRLVEAVHLVEEEDRALAALAEPVAGALEGVAHVLHAGAHGAELLERLAGVGGDGLGQRRLPGARRPPEDHRRQPVALHQRPQRLAPDRAGAAARRCRPGSAAAAAPPAARAPPAPPPPPPRTGPPPSATDASQVSFDASTVTLNPSPERTALRLCRIRAHMRAHNSTQTSRPEGGRDDRTKSSRSTSSARAQHGLITTEQAVEALGPVVGRRRWVTERSARSRCSRPCSGWPERRRPGTRALMAARARRRTGSSRTARPPSCGACIQPAGYVEVSDQAGSRRARSGRPRSSTGSRTFGPASPSSARACADRPGAHGRSTSASSMPLVARRRRAIAEGISHEGSSRSRDVTALRDALGRPGRNGTGIVRAILDGHPRARSARGGERARGAVHAASRKRYDLPSSRLQHEVWETGRFVGRVDAAVPRLKLAIEVDGFEHHSTPEAFQRRPQPAERARRARLDGPPVHLDTTSCTRPGEGRPGRSARPSQRLQAA